MSNSSSRQCNIACNCWRRIPENVPNTLSRTSPVKQANNRTSNYAMSNGYRSITYKYIVLINCL